MANRLLWACVAVLLSAPLPCGGSEADNAATGMGFVCRILSDRNIAVVTPLTGMFPPDARVLFMDEAGNTCATGVVRSSYPDLWYVALDNASAGDCLKKGFLAYSPSLEGQAKFMCRYSLNLPLVIGKSGPAAHALPPNTIVINYVENAMKPVYFHHYTHDFGCRKCHHKDLNTPCRECHPAIESTQKFAPKTIDFEDCVREKCIGCHKGHEGKSSDCAWCHK